MGMHQRGSQAQANETDLLWFFNEFSGACLRGIEYRTRVETYRGHSDDGFNFDIIEDAHRARRVARILARCPSHHVQVLELRYGERHNDPLKSAFGARLAGVVLVTATARTIAARAELKAAEDAATASGVAFLSARPDAPEAEADALITATLQRAAAHPRPVGDWLVDIARRAADARKSAVERKGDRAAVNKMRAEAELLAAAAEGAFAVAAAADAAELEAVRQKRIAWGRIGRKVAA